MVLPLILQLINLIQYLSISAQIAQKFSLHQYIFATAVRQVESKYIRRNFGSFVGLGLLPKNSSREQINQYVRIEPTGQLGTSTVIVTDRVVPEMKPGFRKCRGEMGLWQVHFFIFSLPDFWAYFMIIQSEACRRHYETSKNHAPQKIIKI